MANNKYYTIAEIANLLGISQPNLRYIEKNLHNLKVKKIRGRRYYSEKNIEIIKNSLGIRDLHIDKPQNKKSKHSNSNILDQIIALEKKFTNLQAKLEI